MRRVSSFKGAPTQVASEQRSPILFLCVRRVSSFKGASSSVGAVASKDLLVGMGVDKIVLGSNGLLSGSVRPQGRVSACMDSCGGARGGTLGYDMVITVCL